jgi:hypothetical protein
MQEADLLALFPRPYRGPDNMYRVCFFSHELRYLLPEALFRIHKLSPGERLYLMPDPQSKHDAEADVAAGRLNVLIENLERNSCFFDGSTSTIQLHYRANEYAKLMSDNTQQFSF